MGQTPALLNSGKHDDEFFDKLWETISAGNTWEGRITNVTKAGFTYDSGANHDPDGDSDGTTIVVVQP